MRALNLTVVLLALVLASCSKEAPPAAQDKSLIISTAASTKDVMEALAETFKVEAKINSGPSNGLATQILEGAPADLFLSASQQWADEVQKGGQAVESTRLLTNRLVLVVPKGNPGQVHEPKDLLAAGVKKIALAGEEVPAGKYADQSLTKLDLFKQLESKIVRGQDVRTALAYVERGEAEAGIVYSTDVGVAPAVESVYEFDASTHDEIVYVLVLLKHGSEQAAARKFYESLQSPEADEIYSKFGFSRIK